MKGSKIRAALARRKKAYMTQMPASGQKCHMPGSQNPKNGYGAGSRSR